MITVKSNCAYNCQFQAKICIKSIIKFPFLYVSLFQTTQGSIQRRADAITGPEDVALLERFRYNRPVEMTQMYGTVGKRYIMRYKISLVSVFGFSAHVYKIPVLNLGNTPWFLYLLRKNMNIRI